MIKWLKKIGQILFIWIIAVAFVGVNVKQLYCCHAQHAHMEICMTPDDFECKEGCCGNPSCHKVIRYGYYKIVDCSEVETEMQLLSISSFMTESIAIKVFPRIPEWNDCLFLKRKIPDKVKPQEFLCTYLC